MEIGLMQGMDISLWDAFSVSQVLGLVQTHGWVAQAFQDNLFSNMGQAWNNFIQSGQVWALVIGFVVGYIFRSITAY